MVPINNNKLSKAKLLEELEKLNKKIKRLELYKNKHQETKKNSERNKTGQSEIFFIEGESNYRSLIVSSLDAIYVLQNNKLVLVNPAWEKLFGYNAEEVLLENFNTEKVIAQNYLEIYRKKLLSKLNLPFNQRFDLQGITKDGRKIDLEAHVTKIVWNGKKAIQGINRDITARKKSEEALRREAFIFDNLYDAVIIIDLNGNILNWNFASTNMFGYTKAEILNKNIRILNKNEEILKKKYLMLLKKMGNGRGKLFLKKKDGTSGISETFLFPYIDAQGDKIALVSVNKDITIRKKSEEELKELEDKFRKIAENSLVGMYIIQDGLFKYVNPRFAEITGYKVEELINLLGPLQTSATESYQIVEENIRMRISGEIDTIHYEFKLNSKDRGDIDVEVFGSRIMYCGRPAIAGILLEITERKQDEKTLRESQIKY